MVKSVDTLRAEYKRIRARSTARTNKEFNLSVRMTLTLLGKDNPTPQDYVQAAKHTRFKCRRCAGTGKFITMVENGVPKGPGGICFRCQGTGTRSDSDERRNYGYDVHYRHVVV